jgi:2-polyprenyl-3-methyl-5-hydroxy-6-metoxy-1,4-benzoquinol methylase
MRGGRPPGNGQRNSRFALLRRHARAGWRLASRRVSELLALQETLYTSRNPTRRWLHVTRRARIEATLRRAASAAGPGRALEVGPGSGVYLPLLCELFEQVVASDVEEAFLAHARELARAHPNLEAVADDITASRLPRGSFDVILCSEVIEHIPDSAGALRAMRELLRPGGLLVLSTPQRHSPLEVAGRIAFLPGIVTLVRAVYREPILATGHINLLTAEEVRRQLAAAGLDVLESAQSGVYLPPVAEFGGRFGLKLERWIERRITGGRMSGLLWVQYYLARA